MIDVPPPIPAALPSTSLPAAHPVLVASPLPHAHHGSVHRDDHARGEYEGQAGYDEGGKDQRSMIKLR